ncbi:uncharacterized protein EDB91DRAFT_1131712 [Suillus paluster]|uniref:uncharacterized protein n=1 Tax=Suillus paluster TaxID=48578 RepID=UPI001B865695|nr:uncharacterized protein EDB91DRAFT_1131712 [Suillus paluster]KAG1740836.1 hypothetical protein EDB91DRAFT_1131712 [Suillus paluster]
MNADWPSNISVLHAMLKEHNGVDPILIDQDLLPDDHTKVKVHPCNWDGCTMHVGVEHRHVAKHLQQRHNVSTSATSEETHRISCGWDGCSEQMKPGNLPRHVLSSHLEVRWICLLCSKSLSREDAFRRHTQEKEACQYARPTISYGDGVLEIDTQCINGGWSISQNVICIQ